MCLAVEVILSQFGSTDTFAPFMAKNLALKIDAQAGMCNVSLGLKSAHVKIPND